MKISLSGPLGSNFKQSGKNMDCHSLSLILRLKKFKTHFKKSFLQIRKFLFSYKIIIILLCNSPWAEGKEANLLHWCSPKSLCENHQSCDRHRLSPRNRYTQCLCIRLKYCGLQTLQNSLSNILNQKSFLMICLFLSLINQ